MSASPILTVGLGAFTGGGVQFIPTLGYGTGATPPPPPAPLGPAGSGGGSGDGLYPPMPPYEVPQWAKEERARREQEAIDRAQAIAEGRVAPLPEINTDGLVSPETAAAEQALESTQKLARSVSEIYGVPPAIFEPNDDEEAVLILLLDA